jgi:hypothetical protein
MKQEDFEMLRGLGFCLLAFVAILAAGCNKSDVGTQSSPTSTEREMVPSVASADPNTVAKTQAVSKATHDFLEALRTGNEEEATRLLSTAAREKTAKVNSALATPASDTATFSVGKVRFINDDGAQVSCTWTDLDENNQKHSDEAVWILRLEAEGWRIAGLAVQVFPGEAPLQLNFEDPDEMARKQQWVKDEIRRRMDSSVEVHAETAETPDRTVRQ